MNQKILRLILNNLNLNQDSEIIVIMVALYILHFVKIFNYVLTLEMLLVNCKINIILAWRENCVISEGNRVTIFVITDTKLYARIVTLSTQNNTKLLRQLKTSLKIKINWNIYQ